MRASRLAVLPTKLGSVNCTLDLEVITGNLPLLIRVRSMQTAGLIIDLAKGTALVEKTNDLINLKTASSGHLMINLIPDKYNPSENLARWSADDVSLKDMTKLHGQFTHCSSKRLKKLLHDAGCVSQNVDALVDKATSSCETCEKFGKKPPKPVVGSPLSHAFNGVISLDLHEFRGRDDYRYYIHIIDLFSRYIQAALISSKKGGKVVDVFNRIWCDNYGCPKKVLTDNGKEFDNDTFKQNAEAR